MNFQPKIVKPTLIVSLAFILMTIVIISVTSVAAAPPAQGPAGTRNLQPAPFDDGRSPEFNPSWLMPTLQKAPPLKVDDGRTDTNLGHGVGSSQFRLNEPLDNGRVKEGRDQ